MTSKREQILAYVATQLGGVTGVGGRVYRSRQAAIRKEESPSIIIEPINDQAVQTVVGALTWSLQFRVAVVAHGDIPDQIADPVVSELYGLLMDDRNMGGSALDLLPRGTYFSMMDGDQSIGIIETVFEVTYRTQETTLT